MGRVCAYGGYLSMRCTSRPVMFEKQDLSSMRLVVMDNVHMNLLIFGFDDICHSQFSCKLIRFCP